jgi:hypothetical protein
MRLTHEHLVTRVQTYGRDQYLFAYSVAKGAGIANAAYVLSLLLLAKNYSIQVLPLWLASFGAMLVTYITMFRGTVFLNHRGTWMDTVMPLILALIEFLLFTILQPTSPPRDAFTTWYLLFSIHGFVANVIIWNRDRQIEPGDFSEELHPLILHFKKCLARDWRDSGISAISWLIIWLALSFWPFPKYEWVRQNHTYLGFLAFASMILVIRIAERDREWMLRFLGAKQPWNLPRNEPTSIPEHATDTATISDEQYVSDFTGGEGNDDSKRKNALDKALDIRKFEIDLYWKRAAYFWAFIAVTFAGYFAVLKLEANPASTTLFVINCLGITFSVAWYFANRGSKFWQQNWERHVDYLEDPITGPLYKTVLDRRQYRFWNLTGPFAFSVSRINTVLSLYVLVIWVLLAIRAIFELVGFEHRVSGTGVWVLSIVTALGIGSLFVFGQTGASNDQRGFVRRGRSHEP